MTAAGRHPEQVQRRLTPDLVNQWRGRLGARVGGQAGDPHMRWSGVDGMATYNPLVELSADRPAEFGAMMYTRTLTKCSTYSTLHTPFRLERTPALVRERPYDHLIVLVNTLRGYSAVQQGPQKHTYRPGQLVFVNLAVPYRHHCDAVSDPVGMVIPLDLLGRQRHVAERARRPVGSDTVLSRAAAAFVTRFAIDTAIAGRPAPPVDTELAAIDLITAALAEVQSDSRHRLADDSLFIQEAARDLIERHHRDPDFAPDTVAAHLHVSRRQIYRNFEKAGESLAALIASRRAETARELLISQPGLSIAEIAQAAGFPGAATFRNRFRAQYGVGPREYRKLVQAGMDPSAATADSLRSRM
ncbi:helix-turn-helix domain-containing protein [Gordonia sp. ABSL1-1]|uniref:AraC family transcriptional regulator n=1 Tax=Gordonia sp. ABSL1-1 TaxID=3053923 RepID=UPI002572ED02|nr:AraC family transcriptional regulator [Gordonia sp. ABSL1-1]MDL9937705.1 helix-turn-helix domain-containing protein [Gordonia sp. ABSL1-1]